MDFFSQQDKARASTRKLVILFILAVAALIIITSMLVIGILFYVDGQAGSPGFNQAFLTSRVFITVSIIVIAIVGLGSLARLAQLRAGGKAVAEAMGGRLLNVNTRDADERKILNVVEEMALATGLPVPPVYLMEDEAINAFAAGYKQQDAVIGITRGCIRELSRDELQGVIAHEFSHIFHGDMRLNIRLMGLLYGIMVIGIIGYFIMRGSLYRSMAVRSSSRRGGGGGIVALGLGLVVIGYGGTFFGNLIKAAVSRQREFLADASAVQYTRNPQGIAGALKKIGGYQYGSRISSADASEISHMLFSEGVASGFTGMLATHPPLPQRIKRLEPGWDGKFTSSKPGQTKTAAAGSRSSSSFHNAAAGFSAAIDAIGNPGPEHIELAREQLGSIPPALHEEAHNSLGAGMLVYALLLSFSDAATEKRQLGILQKSLTAANFQALLRMRRQTAGLDRKLFLPLLEIAMPSLKQLSPNQFHDFMHLLTRLIAADEKISLFEWCLFKTLHYNLGDTDKQQRHVSLESVLKECEVLLSVLAAAGHEQDAEAQAAFAKALPQLGTDMKLNYQPQLRNDTATLEKAVYILKDVKPLQKPRLLKAMVQCIAADDMITAEESELLRAVASLLDCPVPPLLQQQKFA